MLSNQQTKVIDVFKDAVRNNKVKQSYILTGEKGSGKSFILPEISSVLMCEKGNGCGVCKGCRCVRAKSHPDVHIISNGNKQVIEIEKIRDAISKAYIMPAMSKYNLFIIENAHLMEAPSQNALLKIIEEPPENVVFIMVCDGVRTLLDTVVSRSMQIEMYPLSGGELKKIITSESADEFHYRYAMGNIGKLTDSLKSENLIMLRNEIIDKSHKIFMGDDIYSFAAFWNKYKDEKEELFELFTLFLRDIVFIKSNFSSEIINTDKINEINESAEKVDMHHALKILENVNYVYANLGKYGHYAMAVQVMLMNLKEEIDDNSSRSSI